MSRFRACLRPAVLAVAVTILLPAAASAQSFGSRPLQRGDSGPDVKTLQRYLTRVSLPTPVAGEFGSRTEGNVRRFESRAGLHPDGIVSRGDAQVLKRAVKATTSASSGGASASSGGAALDGPPPPMGKARLNRNGTATAPADAPDKIKAVIAAGNKIAFKPYHYGGGHGSWTDSGYDCSGSVSFALHGGGLLSSPMASGGLESYGRSGKGSWITIYANGGHVFMYVAGLRYDTSGASADGSRWHRSSRPTSGYVVRHPAGF